MTSHDTTLISMNNHISLKKRGVAITQSHTPTQCRTYFGQYQLISLTGVTERWGQLSHVRKAVRHSSLIPRSLLMVLEWNCI